MAVRRTARMCFDAVLFQSGAHLREVFVVTRLNRAKNTDRRNIGGGECAIVNDLFYARAGGCDPFAQNREAARAIADHSAEPAEAAIRNQTVLDHAAENIRVNVSSA